VTSAIAYYDDSQALFAGLGAIEAEIRDLKRRLTQSAPRNEKPTSSECFRTFVYQKVAELKDVPKDFWQDPPSKNVNATGPSGETAN